jgi:hypothetical protein
MFTEVVGGLPTGLCSHHSFLATSSIFLKRAHKKSLCEIFFSQYEERRM